MFLPSAASSVSGDARPISSPLRVTPERSARSTNESWSGRGRLPVKQRLYLSKQKLGAFSRSKMCMCQVELPYQSENQIVMLQHFLTHT